MNVHLSLAGVRIAALLSFVGGRVVTLCSFVGGRVVTLCSFVGGRFLALVGFLIDQGTTLVELFHNLLGRVVASLIDALGIVWGWSVFVFLLLAAATLNAVGVDDVYGTVARLAGREDTVGVDGVPSVRNITPEEVTDHAGRFSAEAFERATGLTPGEFVHVYVQSHGGRVRQQTIAACLPWSKATVSRLLNALEGDGLLQRVNNGRENIVCTPDAVPGEDGSEP